MQRNLATKIWAKRESGLTAVRLKRDPPVVVTGVGQEKEDISQKVQ